jgi:hypothetical protein
MKKHRELSIVKAIRAKRASLRSRYSRLAALASRLDVLANLLGLHEFISPLVQGFDYLIYEIG